MELVFLGSGGGRFVLSFQKRRTGGFLIKTDKTQIHCDPGPGALVNAYQAKENPTKTRYLTITHQHTDHYGDALAIIEAMTEGTKSHKGTLIANRQLLLGSEREVQGITKFHQSLVDTKLAEPGKEFKFPEFRLVVMPAFHNLEPYAVGYTFDFGNKVLGYTGDTDCRDEVVSAFRETNPDILILNTISPDPEPIQGFMSVGGAIKLIGETKPKLALIKHFGMRALSFGPERMAEIITEKTGVRTIAVRDFMKVNFEEELKRPGLARYL